MITQLKRRMQATKASLKYEIQNKRNRFCHKMQNLFLFYAFKIIFRWPDTGNQGKNIENRYFAGKW